MHDTAERHGFTLIELLVAIFIIGLLAALSLPALQSSIESGRRTTCQNNLRELSHACLIYHAKKSRFPPGLEQNTFNAAPAYRGSTLFVYLLPFLERRDIHGTWDFADPMNNAIGDQGSLTAMTLDLLICPSDIIDKNPYFEGRWYYGITSYGGNGGTRSYFPNLATVDGMFHVTGPASEPLPNQLPVTIDQVKDGQGHTILLGERTHSDPNFASFVAAEWIAPLSGTGWWAAAGGRRNIFHVTMSAYAPLNYQIPFSFSERASASPKVNSSSDFQYYADRRMCAFGSNHKDGANFAFVDGSVRFVSDEITMTVLQALCTRDGKEVLPSY